jgi:hypothetical protein
MLLIEGTIALLLVHADQRYAEIAAAAAKKLRLIVKRRA